MLHGHGIGRVAPAASGALLIAILAALLYGPFLSNPRVFDDAVFYAGQNFAYYATHPIGLEPRTPAYFTLAVIEVLIGSIEAHRVASLVLHILVAWAIYGLILALLRYVDGEAAGGANSGKDPRMLHRHIAAWSGATAYLVHPVAVYGAGYLVQRTVVLATLFALLSIILFARGLARRSHADALSAALMFSLAVMSKEHSIFLPAAAVLVVFLVSTEARFARRHVALYLAACVPAAALLVAQRLWIVGSAYEPHYQIVAAQFGSAAGPTISTQPWAVSAAMQAGLFFKYFGLWLWPDTGAMSVDMRVDFSPATRWEWVVPVALAYATTGAAAFALLRRRGALGVAAYGLLYFWIMFVVEFSGARFQEPFVLYRSYLWAPGIALLVAAALIRLPRQVALAAAAVILPVLLVQAYDRLATFSHPLALWEDAAAKLPQGPVPLGSRTLFNLGREYMYAGRPDRAVVVAERCLTEHPAAFHCHSARGLIHQQLGELGAAEQFLVRAAELNPSSGQARLRLGALYESMGRTSDAMAEYRRAADLGFGGASLEYERLESAQRRRTQKGTTGSPGMTGAAIPESYRAPGKDGKRRVEND